MKRSEKARDVIGFLLQGAQRLDLEELATEEGWKKAELEDALAEAIEYFEELGAESREARLGWCVSALQDLYQKTIQTGDYTAALRCVVEIAKLSKGLRGAGATGQTKGQRDDSAPTARTGINLRAVGGKGRR